MANQYHADESSELGFQEASRSLISSIPESLRAQANLGSWCWEIATDTVVWSPVLRKMFGVAPEGQPPPWAEHPRLYTPESFAALEAAVHRCMESGEPFCLKMEAIRLDDGRHFFVEGHGAAWRDGEGRIARLYGLCLDRTLERRALLDLEQSEARWRLIFEASPMGTVLSRGLTGPILYANPAFVSLAGVEENRVQGYRLEDFVEAPALHVVVRGRIAAKLRAPNGNERWVELDMRKLDGHFEEETYVWLLHDLEPLRFAETARAKAEMAAQEMVESHRIAIANQIHDEMGPLMTGITLLTSKLIGNSDFPEELRGDMQKIQNIAERTIEHCRAIARGLFPRAVSSAEFGPMLRSFGRALSDSFGLAIEYQLEPGWRPTSDRLAAQLYLIAQEAVLNATFHGKARSLRIAIVPSAPGQDSVLTIEDNGSGFADGAIGTSDGCGILIMERRAKSIGGEIRISAVPTGGTKVECLFRV